MTTHDRALNRFVTATIALFLLFGFIAEGPTKAFDGFLRLQISPTRLISDFTVVGGPGAAFLNASAVGILGVLVLRLNKIHLSGPTVAAIFTMMGFALFGKTLMSSIPIIVGVGLAALLVRKQPKEYVLIAMFGTALGPVISFVAFEMGLPPAFALPVSILIGMATGLILPPIAIAMLHLHQGYNLYNMGLAAGFVGLFASSIPNAGGRNMALTDVWGTEANLFLSAIVPLLCLAAILIGWIASREKLWKEFRAIQKLSGRLPSDFCDLEGAGGALLNAGGLGLAYCVFLYIIQAPFNGPVIGGLMPLWKKLQERDAGFCRAAFCRPVFRQASLDLLGHSRYAVRVCSGAPGRGIRTCRRLRSRHAPPDARGEIRALAGRHEPLQQRLCGRPHGNPLSLHHRMV